MYCNYCFVLTGPRGYTWWSVWCQSGLVVGWSYSIWCVPGLHFSTHLYTLTCTHQPSVV